MESERFWFSSKWSKGSWRLDLSRSLKLSLIPSFRSNPCGISSRHGSSQNQRRPEPRVISSSLQAPRWPSKDCFIYFIVHQVHYNSFQPSPDGAGQTQPPYGRQRKVNWTVIQRQRYYSLQISPGHKREGDGRKTDGTRGKLSSTTSANTTWWRRSLRRNRSWCTGARTQHRSRSVPTRKGSKRPVCERTDTTQIKRSFTGRSQICLALAVFSSRVHQHTTDALRPMWTSLLWFQLKPLHGITLRLVSREQMKLPGFGNSKRAFGKVSCSLGITLKMSWTRPVRQINRGRD